MTEKRFTVPSKYSLSHSKIQCDGTPLTNDELVRILNTNDGAFLENFNLKKENKELKEENEQLKSFKSRVFNLLQDEIREESELLDYYLKEKAPYNADRQQIIIGVLKRLQKELKE